MDCNVQKPTITKLKICFGGQPPRGTGAAAETSTCTLCGRTFSSVKALHGHMRWHKPVPLQPPTTQKLADQLDFDPPPRPLPLPLSWIRTAKRTLVVPVETDPEVFDGREVEGEGEGKDPAEEEEAPASEMSTNAGTVVSEEDLGTLEHCGQARDPSESPPCGRDCCRRWHAQSGYQHAAPAQFSCLPCGRAFTSYPALCGHMASHGKQHNHLRDGDPRLDGSWKAPKRRRVKGAAAGPAEHRCNVCGRVFPTGQALGGHKRLHWEGPKICPTLLLLPPPAATPAELEKDTPARVHDFDLNETPVCEDGGERNMQELLLLV